MWASRGRGAAHDAAACNGAAAAAAAAPGTQQAATRCIQNQWRRPHPTMEMMRSHWPEPSGPCSPLPAGAAAGEGQRQQQPQHRWCQHEGEPASGSAGCAAPLSLAGRRGPPLPGSGSPGCPGAALRLTPPLERLPLRPDALLLGLVAPLQRVLGERGEGRWAAAELISVRTVVAQRGRRRARAPSSGGPGGRRGRIAPALRREEQRTPSQNTPSQGKPPRINPGPARLAS